MTSWKDDAENYLAISLKIITFALLLTIIVVAFWALNWKVNAELDVVILALISYTLLLVLPISDFDFSLTGLKAKVLRKKIDELSTEVEDRQVSTESVKDVTQKMAYLSPNLDTTFMRLMIEIQATLDKIAELVGIPTRKYSLGALITELNHQTVLKEPWLMESLHFLRRYRNEILHLKKTNYLERAISIEESVLAELKDIKKQIEEKQN
jgi:hypothetical protein